MSTAVAAPAVHLSSRICPEINPKQVEAFEHVMGAVAHYEAIKKARAHNAEVDRVLGSYVGGPTPPDGQVIPERMVEPLASLPCHTRRQFFYGGAIRGGKTFLYLTILVILAKLYPGSRAHVVRKSFTELEGITKSSLERIIGTAPVRWKKSTKEYFVQFSNGSRIYLFSENYNADPSGNRFLGLETNFILLEQMEELQFSTLQMCMQRVASWRMAKEAPGLILGTFNPTFGWVKEHVYDAWKKDPSACPFIYTPALPTDNKTNTDEQFAQWANLDPVTYARMIGGEWEIDLKGRFMHAFDHNRHVVPEVEYDPEHDLRYSFDFNVDPSCAIVFQTDRETFFHILDEVRVEEGDTPVVCDILKERWRAYEPWEKVTGDASGLNRMSGLRGHLNQFQVIRDELGITDEQFELATLSNPDIPDSRVFCNSIFARFPRVRIAQRCKYLIHDLNFVQIKRDAEGRVGIKKTGKLANAPMNAESMGHLMDCCRYAMHSTLFQFVTIPRS